jgi:hypothetical protein
MEFVSPGTISFSKRTPFHGVRYIVIKDAEVTRACSKYGRVDDWYNILFRKLESATGGLLHSCEGTITLDVKNRT